jgi:hypothetical protein
MAVGECSKSCLPLKFTIYPCFSLMNLDELALYLSPNLTRLYLALSQLEYERGLAFH